MKSSAPRRVLALVLALLVASSLGCSKPIDPGSSVPAELQPLVFLIAAVGVGFGIAALDHHNSNGSSPSAPSLTAPTFVGSVGNSPFDLATDPSVPGSVGALGTNGGTGGYGFTELGTSSTNSGSYALTAGYRPVAVAIDGVGDDWFDDSAGNLQSCAPPTSTPRTCAPLVTLNDGLGSGGVRGLVADASHVFIVNDNGRGTVNWSAFALDGTGKLTGSYAYSGSGIFGRDAVATVSGGLVGTYIVFHQNGTSWSVPLPGPAAQNTFKFNPVPLASANVAYDGTNLYYGLLGSPTSGSYQIGRYAAVGNAQGKSPGSLLSSITIGFNGQTSPNAPMFALPVQALRTDGVTLYMLDAQGNLVTFGAF